MCTLTILPTEDGHCLITMSRDERRDRIEPGKVFTHSQVTYPLDSHSGGTWFASDRRGCVLSLLNRYQSPFDKSRASRGGLIPLVLQQKNPVDWLIDLDPAAYNPFDLFCIDAGHIWHCSWGGVESDQGYRISEINLQKGFMFSSSSWNTHAVLAYRQELFSQWLWSAADQERVFKPRHILHGFHLLQDRERPQWSVLMDREWSHTKSVCQVNTASPLSSFCYLLRDVDTSEFVQVSPGKKK